LSQAHPLFDVLFEVVPAAVVVCDVEGRVLLLNPAGQRALGYRAEDVARLHVTDLYHRMDEARRVKRWLREDKGNPVGFDVTLRNRVGELIPARVSAAILRDEAGAEVGSVGVFEDRRAELALGARLEEAAGQVEESERRVAASLSIGNSVHEISQPLAAAMGNVELLVLDNTLPEGVRDRAQRAWDQLDRLRGVVARIARTRPRSRA
jgi:PAS domain S-box-containing protein